MQNDFTINEITINSMTKTICIHPAFDIDPDSINEGSIQLFKREDRTFINYDYKIEGKLIYLVLKEYPEPNQEYVLKINKLKNILGKELDFGIRKKIIFKSSITSKANIISPAFNEEISKLYIKVEELLVDEKQSFINSFFIEISSDVNFYNIITSTQLNQRNEVELDNIKPGQYYIRTRIQTDKEYGLWSETNTFFVIDKNKNDRDYIEDDNKPIYIEEMKILSSPKQGETPKSFLFEMDCPIDSDFLDKIIILREEV